MLTTLFALLAQASASAAPSLSAISVDTGTGGACSGGAVAQSATLVVSWTLTNPDPVHYEIKIYENNIFIEEIAGDNVGWTKTITGSVQADAGGSGGVWSSNWTYRAEMVRLSDGVSISSVTASPWVMTYGSCGSGDAT